MRFGVIKTLVENKLVESFKKNDLKINMKYFKTKLLSDKSFVKMMNVYNNLNENNIYTRHFIIRNPSAYSFFNNDDADFLTPIVIRPTQEQINNATEECIFSSIEDPPNSSCPISLVPFQNNDLVYKIKYCGHIFFKNQLENWLYENTKCPLCRYDLRDYQN